MTNLTLINFRHYAELSQSRIVIGLIVPMPFKFFIGIFASNFEWDLFLEIRLAIEHLLILCFIEFVLIGRE